jgi:hypothetical protein
MGAAEVEQFLTELAVHGHVSASTQNQALNALVFVYQQVLEIDLGRFDAVRARRSKRLPEMLTYTHVARKGVSAITSPLDLLADAGPESVRSAIDGTLRLRAAVDG